VLLLLQNAGIQRILKIDTNFVFFANSLPGSPFDASLVCNGLEQDDSLGRLKPSMLHE
jgi:hypothetical protein